MNPLRGHSLPSSHTPDLTGAGRKWEETSSWMADNLNLFPHLQRMVALSLENRKRKSVVALDFFKNEINLRLQIYEKCVCIDSIHIDRMKELVLHL